VKKTIPIFVFVAVLVIFLLLMSLCFIQEKKITTFSVDDFEKEISIFSSSICTQPVYTSQDAVHVAKSIWIEVYGYGVLLNRPYIVSFDDSNNVWLIKGSANGIHLGGIPYLLVHQDGSVIAIWHDK